MAHVMKSAAPTAGIYHDNGSVTALTTVEMGRMNSLAVPVSQSPFYIHTCIIGKVNYRFRSAI